MQRKIEEPIHILNIAVRVDSLQHDDYYAHVFGEFCAESVSSNLKQCYKPIHIWTLL